MSTFIRLHTAWSRRLGSESLVGVWGEGGKGVGWMAGLEGLSRRGRVRKGSWSGWVEGMWILGIGGGWKGGGMGDGEGEGGG